MKTWKFAVCWMITGAAAFAAGLPKENVAADAKWLLHLDVAEFKNTQIGQNVAKSFLDAHWETARQVIKPLLNVDLDWRQVDSITVYGTDPTPNDNAVVLIKTDAATQQGVEAALRKKLQDAKDPDDKAVEEPAGNGSILALGNDLFVAPQKGGLTLLGKHRASLENASAVLAGKAANLKTSTAFAGLPEDPKGFFFLAMAEGFATPNHLPPQAQILQQAEGGKLVLGENGDRLFLNISLKAKTVEASQQIQKIVQGLQALMALSQDQNPDLMELSNATQVSANGKVVTASIEYPITKAFERLAAAAAGKDGPEKNTVKKERKPKKEKRQKTAPNDAATPKEKPAQGDKPAPDKE